MSAPPRSCPSVGAPRPTTAAVSTPTTGIDVDGHAGDVGAHVRGGVRPQHERDREPDEPRESGEAERRSGRRQGSGCPRSTRTTRRRAASARRLRRPAGRRGRAGRPRRRGGEPRRRTPQQRVTRGPRGRCRSSIPTPPVSASATSSAPSRPRLSAYVSRVRTRSRRNSQPSPAMKTLSRASSMAPGSGSRAHAAEVDEHVRQPWLERAEHDGRTPWAGERAPGHECGARDDQGAGDVLDEDQVGGAEVVQYCGGERDREAPDERRSQQRMGSVLHEYHPS